MKAFLFLLVPLFLSFTLFNIQENGPSWSVLCSGKKCKVMERKTMIFRNSKAYEKAWKELREVNSNLAEQPPAVDFKKKTVIAFCAGDQTNGLEADSLWINKNELIVRLTRIEMMPNCHLAKLLVTPYVWIETDRIGWHVLKTTERVRDMDCK